VPEPVLDVRDLSVRFATRQGVVTAVDHLSFTVGAGEVLGIVGESGSGKSVTVLAVLRLLTDANVQIEGQVLFRGKDLLALPEAQLRSVRGREIAMIFQDPMTALTPVYTVGWHIAEQLRAHQQVSKADARARAIELLDEVGIPNPGRRVDAYPHEFSGGMRQRACIAMALACDPALLIADEPTTALDVTIQAQILALMNRLREQHGSSIVLITHDMGVVSETADRVMVMYGGRAVEEGTRTALFRNPQHPYTWGLLSSVPRTDRPRTRRLAAIPGVPPSPLNLPAGCAFSPRCAFAHEKCRTTPALEERTPGHWDACWLPPDVRPALRLRSESAAEQART
jgi:peptide/nickel transport system ATP-binding protein